MNARIAFVSAALLAIVPTAFAAPQGAAQTTPTPGATMPQTGKMGKMMNATRMNKMAGPVYVCTPCKMYTNAAGARKMKMMDPMGHKLVKMAKVPAGYTMMKSDSMGSMGHKMDGPDMAPKASGSPMSKP